MDYIDIYRTDDGSVGLYNKDVQDIYHASAGAYTESLEKFILPAGIAQFAAENKQIKILDVCYGIGYNSKLAIEAAVRANKNIQIKIDALETDINLILLSTMLKQTTLPDWIDYFIIDELKAQNLIEESIISKIIKNKLFKSHTDATKAAYLKKSLNRGHLCLCCDVFLFLHNIYYQYISKRFKKGVRHLKNRNFTICFNIGDARHTVTRLDNCYDFIFLDAFTPKLSPCLWTYDFISELYKKLDNDGLLLTYSKAKVVRSALLACGFSVGNIFNTKNKIIGTVASKNTERITYTLTDYELGLLNTTAGIFYRDKDLSLCDDEILANREIEKMNSTRQTSSAYIKEHGGQN